jgi:hypothetical protein
MTIRNPLLVFTAALAVTAACSPKSDTAPPTGGDGDACTEEAQECPDGSTVSRAGPDCEFAACPGEDEGLDDVLDDDADEAAADAGDDADADEADADEADADEDDAEG